MFSTFMVQEAAGSGYAICRRQAGKYVTMLGGFVVKFLGKNGRAIKYKLDTDAPGRVQFLCFIRRKFSGNCAFYLFCGGKPGLEGFAVHLLGAFGGAGGDSLFDGLARNHAG